MKGVDVSIVVPVAGEHDLTWGLLRSLPAAAPSQSVQVILVESATDDRFPIDAASAEIARDRDGVVIESVLQDRDRGFYHWLNWGIQHARGTYLGLFNNDLVLGARSIALIVDAIEAFHLSAAYPTHSTGVLPSDFAERAADQSTRPLAVVGPPEFRGFCVMLRRDTCDRIGPFDEGFKWNLGDDDYWCRLVGDPTANPPRQVDPALVHHYGQATTNRRRDGQLRRWIKQDGTYWTVKWGSETPPEIVRRALAGRAILGPFDAKRKV